MNSRTPIAAPATSPETEAAAEPKPPLVASVCGTYLKREMQSIYRQISGLERLRTVVLAEQTANLELFPFEPLVELVRLPRPYRRHRGNFALRFWFKHVVRQWPPPRPVGHAGREGLPSEYYHPYDLIERLREWNPAVAHVYYGHKAVKYRRMLEDWGGRWIVSFHGVDVAKFVDEPGYVDELKLVFRDAELILARSQSLLDRLKELGAPPEKLRMNRTPIPLENIEAKVRRPPEDGAWRLVQACRLIPKKGILTTLEAMVEVTKRWPKSKYVLCGTGPQEEAIRTAVSKLQLEGNVELRGWLDQAELRREMDLAHVFLHPSELTGESDQEGVPNSMLEGMGTGLPVVATLHGGIPEAVESGTDGLLVPERSPEQLAGSLLRLLGDAGLLARFSANARESVVAKFDARRQIAALEDCYIEAMKPTDRPGAQS